MLAVVEDYLVRIRAAKGDDDIVALLSKLAAKFGFRSAYLAEYTSTLRATLHILDSDTDRKEWWSTRFAVGTQTGAPLTPRPLVSGTIQYVDRSRFSGPDDPALQIALDTDLLSAMLVPISFDDEIVGLVALCGERRLPAEHECAIRLICYSLFSQTRTFRHPRIGASTVDLTPREREVMGLSAKGLTSLEVASRLGMSPRTVNQHIDHAALKLKTRNRVHTVAEAIRHALL